MPLQVQHPIHKENELLVEPTNSNCEPLETDEICNGKEINGIEEGDIILLQGIPREWSRNGERLENKGVNAGGR